MPENSHADDMTTLHVQRAVAGDDDSRTWIVERFTPLLLAQAGYRMRGDLGKVCEPADIVQEVWLRVLPRLTELTPEERFTPTLVAYLSRAVIMQINNHLRTMLRRRGHGAQMPWGGEQGLERTDDATGIVSRMARGERRDAVLAALDELSDLDREVIVLRGIEQRSNTETAQLLDAEPGTVAVRFHRSLRRLREKLPQSVFAEFALPKEDGGDTTD